MNCKTCNKPNCQEDHKWQQEKREKDIAQIRKMHPYIMDEFERIFGKLKKREN